MIKIKISNLANGRYEFDFSGDVNELDIPEPFSGKFKTNIALTKFDNQIILDSETVIPTSLVCDRCTRDFQSEIHSKFRMVYLFRTNFEESEKEKVDVVYLHPEADKIDLDKDIRDFAILAIPMKRLCSEDCKGLCPKCGKNLNDGPCNCTIEIIDPRWEPILKMKTKNN
jgi:uncharacterized protein